MDGHAPYRLRVGDVLAINRCKRTFGLKLRWTVREITSDDGRTQEVIVSQRNQGSARVSWKLRDDEYNRYGEGHGLKFHFHSRPRHE